MKNDQAWTKTKKASTNGSIPATTLKQFVEAYLPFFAKAINLAITEGEFPDILKNLEVLPLYRK